MYMVHLYIRTMYNQMYVIREMMFDTLTVVQQFDPHLLLVGNFYRLERAASAI